jgi:hypothetical protein
MTYSGLYKFYEYVFGQGLALDSDRHSFSVHADNFQGSKPFHNAIFANSRPRTMTPTFSINLTPFSISGFT